MKSEPKKHTGRYILAWNGCDIWKGEIPTIPARTISLINLFNQQEMNEIRYTMLSDIVMLYDVISYDIDWCCMLSPCWLVTSPLWPHRFQLLRVHQAAVATPARVRRVDRSGWRMRRAMRSCQWPPTCSQLRNSMHHFCNTAWPVSTLKTCQYHSISRINKD